VHNESPYIEMYFSLAGSRDIYILENFERSFITAGCHNLYYIPVSGFYIKPPIDEEENISVQIQFTEDYFKRFLPTGHSLFSEFVKKINKKEFSSISKTALPITTEMFIILNDIVHCEKEGILKQLFIETNVLKLLLLQFEQYGLSATAKEKPSVKLYDVEKLNIVKSLLDQDISYPHSMGELCRKSGLNDFKLKKGFKELFGVTVFGYLHELRMEKAKELLNDNLKPIVEIAEYCGYTYVQSFSTAFRRRYGITPEKFRKKK
jgi:AraC-like DNA-binding protein